MNPTPTQRQAQALAAIRNNTDAVEYLKACLEARKAKMLMLNNIADIRVCQGQAQFCADLLDEILGTTQKSAKRRH